MEILDADEEGLVTLFNSYKEPIPTKLSQFQNDTEYLTKDNINVTSPIIKGSTLNGEIDLWLQSTYNNSFAQYSSGVKTGTLDVGSWVEKSGYFVYTIEDYSIFNYNTDVLMTVNSPVTLEASDLTDRKIEIKTKTKPTEPIQYSYKLLATKEKGQLTIVNTYIPTVGEWVTVTGETATLTQAGTYQVVIPNGAQSIVYWDGSTVAEGIKSTDAEVDTNNITINTTYPHIAVNGTLSMNNIVVSNATGSWVKTTTTLSGFKYRKIN